jgi:hypothetical protein
MKKLPITEVRSLLDSVSEHGKQHLIEVDADLSQTIYLLSKAIEKLNSSFMAVHTAVTNQQKALEALMQQHQFTSEEKSKINMYNQIIAEEVGVAITGLQFQDITNQLLVRAMTRVNGLKELLEELHAHGGGINSEYEHNEIAKLLEMISDSLHHGSHALSGGLRRSVEQKNMASGDIELL